jgi:hypothetical protein
MHPKKSARFGALRLNARSRIVGKSSHKSQHWIPRSYLRAWTDPASPAGQKPFVHVYSKDGGTHRIKAPDNLFSATDLYTIKLPDGGRDLRLEHGLADLESGFALLRKDFLLERRKLSAQRHIKFMVFVAAMHARTPTFNDHHMRFWKEVQSKGEQMERWIKTATPEEKQRAASVSLPSSQDRPSMSMEDVRKITENPMRFTLGFVGAELPHLIRMRSTILCTDSDPGFITSDAPVIWFDPDWYKKPPIYRSPSLSDPRLEITLPISPNQMLLLTHPQDDEGVQPIQYLDVSETVVVEANRRLRFQSDKEFVASRAFIDPRWFERGTPPPDTWGARQDPEPK